MEHVVICASFAQPDMICWLMRRRAPFIAVLNQAFALPCQLLPGETWYGASASAPTQVHTLLKLFSWKLLEALFHSSAEQQYAEPHGTGRVREAPEPAVTATGRPFKRFKCCTSTLCMLCILGRCDGMTGIEAKSPGILLEFFRWPGGLGASGHACIGAPAHSLLQHRQGVPSVRARPARCTHRCCACSGVCPRSFMRVSIMHCN